MPKIISILLLGILVLAGLFFLWWFKIQNETEVPAAPENAKSIYKFEAKLLATGETRRLSHYKGNVLLIVNTASKCGLTPQYADLQSIHEEYNGKGLSVLGFPANNFLSQEPGSNEDIARFCQKNYGVTFDMFEKIDVKGKNKHPIYRFLTQKDKNGVRDSKVQWNFQKYVLDRQGRVAEVIYPKTRVTDEKVRQKIDSLLAD